MTDPNDSDDTWGDLARELGLDEPTFASTPPEEPGDEAESGGEEFGEFEDAGLVEAEPGSGDSDSDDAEGDAEGESGESPADDGQPGPGRKRRRRRRRRKKGGAPGQPGEAAENGDEAAAADAEPAEDEEIAAPIAAPVRYESDDDEAEEIEPTAVPLAAEEDTGSEVLRELIATWNVPSWDDIVGGLYRPER